MQVAIYREGLGCIPPEHDTSKPTVPIPTFIIIRNLDHLKVTFIKCTKAAADIANKFLESKHAAILLAHRTEGEMKIICKLHTDQENLRKLSENWEKNVIAAVNEILSGFDTQSITCLPKCWKDICSRIARYKQENAAELSLAMISEQSDIHQLHIVSTGSKLQGLVCDVQKICQDVQESQDQVTESMDVSLAKLEVLRKMDFVGNFKKQLPKISTKLDTKNKKLMLKGNPKDMLTAVKQVYDILKDLVEKTIPVSSMMLKVISSAEGWQYFTDCLKASNLSSVIECAANPSSIIITALKDQCDQTEDVLQKTIVESQLPIDPDSIPGLKSPEWSAFLQENIATFPGKIEIALSKDFSTLAIVSTDDLCDYIRETLDNYMRDHTIKKQFIPAAAGCIRLLRTYSYDEIKQIIQDFSKYGVKITDGIKDGEPGFDIEGVSDGFNHSIARLKELIMTVEYDSSVVNQPGLPKFLLSKEGRMLMSGAETSHRVAFEILDLAEQERPPDGNSSKVMKPRFEELDSVVTEHGTAIKVTII